MKSSATGNFMLLLVAVAYGSLRGLPIIKSTLNVCGVGVCVCVIPEGQGRPTAGPGSCLEFQSASDALRGAA